MPDARALAREAAQRDASRRAAARVQRLRDRDGSPTFTDVSPDHPATPFPPSPMSRDSEMETRLAAIEARANAAAEGPWDVGAERDGVYGGRRTVVRDSSLLRIVSVGQTRLHDNLGAEANVEFIAHAREDVPWLIGRVRELESRLSGAPGQKLTALLDAYTGAVYHNARIDGMESLSAYHEEERVDEDTPRKALLEYVQSVGAPGAGDGARDTTKVTRFEVIDHRRQSQSFGRVFGAHHALVTLSYQDGGHTLKAFVDDRPSALSSEEQP